MENGHLNATSKGAKLRATCPNVRPSQQLPSAGGAKSALVGALTLGLADGAGGFTVERKGTFFDAFCPENDFVARASELHRKKRSKIRRRTCNWVLDFGSVPNKIPAFFLLNNI